VTANAGLDEAVDGPFTGTLTGEAADDALLAERPVIPVVVAEDRRRRPVAVPDDVPLTPSRQ
jgi:hypothetical protein